MSNTIHPLQGGAPALPAQALASTPRCPFGPLVSSALTPGARHPVRLPLLAPPPVAGFSLPASAAPAWCSSTAPHSTSPCRCCRRSFVPPFPRCSGSSRPTRCSSRRSCWWAAPSATISAVAASMVWGAVFSPSPRCCAGSRRTSRNWSWPARRRGSAARCSSPPASHSSTRPSRPPSAAAPSAPGRRFPPCRPWPVRCSGDG